MMGYRVEAFALGYVDDLRDDHSAHRRSVLGDVVRRRLEAEQRWRPAAS